MLSHCKKRSWSICATKSSVSEIQYIAIIFQLLNFFTTLKNFFFFFTCLQFNKLYDRAIVTTAIIITNYLPNFKNIDQ